MTLSIYTEFIKGFSLKRVFKYLIFIVDVGTYLLHIAHASHSGTETHHCRRWIYLPQPYPDLRSHRLRFTPIPATPMMMNTNKINSNSNLVVTNLY